MEKKIPRRKFFEWIFSINRINRKKQKSREEHIEDELVELKKDLLNFQITAQKKDKTIQEYVRLLKLTKQEYQKLFQENKILKDKLNLIQKEKNNKKITNKRP